MRSLTRFVVATAIAMGLVWILTLYGERVLLLDLVVPLAGTTIDFWISDFMQASAYGIWIAGSGSLIWFLFARWLLPISDWKSAGRRWIWFTIGAIIVAICTVYGFYYVPLTETGGPVAYVFFFVNATLIYYFSTVLASPPSYKYTPIGAKAIRIV